MYINVYKQPKILGSFFFVTDCCQTHFRTAPERLKLYLHISLFLTNLTKAERNIRKISLFLTNQILFPSRQKLKLHLHIPLFLANLTNSASIHQYPLVNPSIHPSTKAITRVVSPHPTILVSPLSISFTMLFNTLCLK